MEQELKQPPDTASGTLEKKDFEMTLESIHADGRVELIQSWIPGPARGNQDFEFIDGEQYVFAICLVDDRFGKRRNFWEFHVVTARGDSETPLNFDLPNCDPWDDFDWNDVDWFIPVRYFDLPM